MHSLARLAALPAGVRRDLLWLLTRPDEERAGLLGEFFARSETRELGDVLIEQEEFYGFGVIALLEELEGRAGG